MIYRALAWLSLQAHRALYGADQTLCARAWELRARHRFWRLWVAVFDYLLGKDHCRDSWREWRR